MMRKSLKKYLNIPLNTSNNLIYKYFGNEEEMIQRLEQKNE